MALFQAITVGLKRVSDTVKAFYVRDSAGTERKVFDTDGKLYNVGDPVASGTKVTKIADPADGTTVDAEARTAIAAIIDALEEFGISSST